mmetsp:Transcript_58626/g.166790  ORF Transcript_58626/g.166790 Transcript_58626/m.166790 type:complete len:210 (-) Transcript_58626:296-925(-)
MCKSAEKVSDVVHFLAGLAYGGCLLMVVLPEEPSHNVARVAQVTSEEIQVRHACVGAAMHHLQAHLPERHPLRARVNGPRPRPEEEAAASQPELVDLRLHPLPRHVDAHEIRVRTSAAHTLGISFHTEEHLRPTRLDGNVKQDVDAGLHHVEVLPMHVDQVRVALRARYRIERTENAPRDDRGHRCSRRRCSRRGCRKWCRRWRRRWCW